MIKVFVRPTGLHSHAMMRVAKALSIFAPPNVEIVDGNPNDADIRLHHVIGPDPLGDADPNQPHILIQYCLLSAGHNPAEWATFWSNAELVWSYYDLPAYLGETKKEFNFYYAPLGVDPTFRNFKPNGRARDIGVMTSGFVSAGAAEAIEEAAWAANDVGKRVVHLGPWNVDGMTSRPPQWKAVMGISDKDLAMFYGRTQYVSGLRHVEGFELPALEGLMCGARPVLFDRPEMRKWYDGVAVFVPECSGQELVDRLMDVFRGDPSPISEAERQHVAERFDWKSIATNFWEHLL